MSPRGPMDHYQPVYVRGEVRGEMMRACDDRFDAIAAHFPAPGFSLLDVGANRGYFSLRAAHEFDARATAVDGAESLPEALEEAQDPRVVMVNRNLTAEEVSGLERHDVGLLLSVLHHVPDPVEMLEAVRSRVDLLFVEAADPSENENAQWAERAALVIQHVESSGGRRIGEAASIVNGAMRPIYLMSPKAKRRKAGGSRRGTRSR